MSKSSSTPPPTRRERRAAERNARFDAERDQRRARGATASGSSGLLTTRNLTFGALAIGVLLVAVLAISQLGPRATGSFKDPGLEYPVAIQDDNALGNAGAPVLLEVWGDYQCPVCARHSLDVEPALVNQFVLAGQLRIVHHEFDLLGRGGEESRLPAIGAACAVNQDAYWNYSHWMYANQDGENRGGFRRERVVAIAEAAGLNRTEFETCLDTAEAIAAFDANQAKATELGVSSTPTMYLNGTRSVGLKSPSEWAALIEAELAKATASPVASPVGSPTAPGSEAP